MSDPPEPFGAELAEAAEDDAREARQERRRRARAEQRRLAAGEEGQLAARALPFLLENGWLESWRQNRCVDAEGEPIPWITYPALSFLAERVAPDMSVFEFGSGSSTLWWSTRVARVTSVEHDEAWYRRVLADLPDNATLTHVPLEPGGDYCRQVRRAGEPYDVVVVDGRDRVNCAMQSVGCLTPTGVIVWDNSDRRRYGAGLQALARLGFRRIPFVGLAPLSSRASETSVLYRDENCLGL